MFNGQCEKENYVKYLYIKMNCHR